MPLILVVDDDPDDVLLTQNAVQRSGVKNKVICLASGMAAMNYLQRWLVVESGGWIAQGLLLLDFKMPGVSGLEVLKWVRLQPRLQEMKVILLTHSDDPKILDAANDAGADRCIRKSERDELMRTVQEALAEAQAG